MCAELKEWKENYYEALEDFYELAQHHSDDDDVKKQLEKSKVYVFDNFHPKFDSDMYELLSKIEKLFENS